MDRRELPVEGEREQRDTEKAPKPGIPWGFVLVLAAIVVVAIVYSVTIFAIEPGNRTPANMFGAMAASFTIIGTLVGTYFGIKAGLDGQDKVKQTLTSATEKYRSPGENERNGDRKVSGQRLGGGRNGDRRRSGEQGGEETVERTWHGEAPRRTRLPSERRRAPAPEPSFE